MAGEQDPADPEAIKRGWIETMYSKPPDLVFDEQTGWSAANPGAPSADQNPMEPEDDPEADWRRNVKEWFDRLP